MPELATREHHQILIIGAGPGGIAAAADLADQGFRDVLILEKGIVGQSWLDYPTETKLLSASTPENDDNMIANIPFYKVFPNIEHPSHIMFQRYLEHVASTKALRIREHSNVKKVMFDEVNKQFIVELADGTQYSSQFCVCATGIFSKPKDDMNSEGCYIHYAKLPYLDNIDDAEVTVVGSANGASGVVMSVAKPGRLVTLVTSHKYEVPQPVDCLWKENMVFVQNLVKQGLVKIVEDFRVKRIFHQRQFFVLESTTGQQLMVKNRPIICTGFSANIDPIRELVSEVCWEHEDFIAMDEYHQSLRQPGLYVAGTIGKRSHDDGFIRHFRDYGKKIADSIRQQIHS